MIWYHIIWYNIREDSLSGGRCWDAVGGGAETGVSTEKRRVLDAKEPRWRRSTPAGLEK